MEFMNVGGGELLIIILFALVLFSPEDIIKLMRTIGKYTRTARQMWSNVSKSLQEEYLPEDVKEVVQETASSVKQAKSTLSDVRKQFNDISTSVEDDVKSATQLADKEISKAVATVNEGQDKAKSGNTPVKEDNKTTDISAGASGTKVASKTSPDDTESSSSPNASSVSNVIDAKQIPQKGADDASLDFVSMDATALTGPQDAKDNDSASLTKEDTAQKQEHKGNVLPSDMTAKLAKVSENSLKEDGNDN
jgi:Sec-independent protein translocase protein TatA